ncbi:hypothetical protein CsSME_00000157 [Camellia sinensis var. sinensis]
MASTLMMRMMGLRYPLKIPQGKERRAYQQETMWMDCNSVFPSDDQIGMMARLRSLARFEGGREEHGNEGDEVHAE